MLEVGRKRKIADKSEKGIWLGPVSLSGLCCAVRVKREERGRGNEGDT